MGKMLRKQAWLVHYQAKEFAEHTQSHHNYAYGKQINVVADDVLGAVVKAQEYSESVKEAEFKVEAVSRRSMILVPEGKGLGLGYQVTYSYGHPRNKRNGKTSLIAKDFFSALEQAISIANAKSATYGLFQDYSVDIHDVNYLGKHYYA